MKNNKIGFSIIFSIIFVVLISLLVIYILEFILPFSRDTKGVENSSASYYESIKGVEDGLFYARDNELQDRGDVVVQDSVNTVIANTSSLYDTLPIPGEGNSEYDKDYNIINAGNPIQLEIGNGVITDWSNDLKIYIQAPDIDRDGSNNDDLSSTPDNILINWQLSSANDTLSAIGTSYIKASNISSGTYNKKIKLLSGVKLDGITSSTIQAFYSSECMADKCSLKFSVVNELKSTSSGRLPYLEWKIDFDTNVVPRRFYKIISVGNAGPFRKILEVNRPQQTVIQAFDFTVIQ